MCTHGKFSLLERVFRVPFLDFNDVASAIISSSMERFRLALALPVGTRQDRRSLATSATAWPRSCSRHRLLGGARFSERSGVIRAKRGQARPIGLDPLAIWHLSEAEEWVNQMRRLPL